MLGSRCLVGDVFDRAVVADEPPDRCVHQPHVQDPSGGCALAHEGSGLGDIHEELDHLVDAPLGVRAQTGGDVEHLCRRCGRVGRRQRCEVRRSDVVGGRSGEEVLSAPHLLLVGPARQD